MPSNPKLPKDRSPGWAQRAINPGLTNTTGKDLLSRLALVWDLGQELISAAQWAAQGLEYKEEGNPAKALEAFETTTLAISRVQDLLKDAYPPILAQRRRLETTTNTPRKPSNL